MILANTLILLNSVFLTQTTFGEEPNSYVVPEISVLGETQKKSPFELVPAVSQVSGTKLERKKQSTLGETLSKEAGVSSSYFGPNSSRPVIRGLDGDRIRMLENGIGVLDASGASPDHAIAIDPMLVESIEVLRGPSALLYGSSAIGGVVNVRTNRISSQKIDENSLAFSSRFSTVDSGKNLGGVARYRLGQFIFHMDGSIRSSEDLSVPGFAKSKPEPGDIENRVQNSANRTSQAATGLTYHFEKGYLGTSFSGYLSQYGTTKMEEGNPVRINMDRFRADLAGEVKDVGYLDSIRIKSAFSKYEHRELAGESVGTIFKNRGVETRIDGKTGDLMIGLQQQYFKFSALGKEAFLPSTDNSSYAVFGYHEWNLGFVKPSFGLRLDSVQVKSETDPVFGAGKSKNYFSTSSSLGFQKEVSEWTLGLNTTYTERAPNYQELFARGEHVATGIFEVGDQEFKTEKNLGLEFSFKLKKMQQDGRLSFFYQGFQNYIALSPTGTSDPGEDGIPGNADDIPIFNYQAIKAKLFGAELEYLYQFPTVFAGGLWESEVKWDWVRGLDVSNGGNLPRITPMRGTLGLNYKHSLFSAEIEYQRVEGQSLLARNETPTSGYQLVNLGAEIPLKINHSPFKILMRINNVFDVMARNHLSFLKDEVPLPGRNITLGLQAYL